VLDLTRLKPEQREAVTATEGPLLVVAGPGFGKTAVIAARVAYLIDQGLAEPSEVLAVTFTNKAGRELNRRLASVLGEQAQDVWAGTFHPFALRVLRQWGGHFGFDPDHLSVHADEKTDGRRSTRPWLTWASTRRSSRARLCWSPSAKPRTGCSGPRTFGRMMRWPEYTRPIRRRSVGATPSTSTTSSSSSCGSWRRTRSRPGGCARSIATCWWTSTRT